MSTQYYNFPEIDPNAAFNGAADLNTLAEDIDTAIKQVEILGKDSTYTLPAASKTKLGGVRIGANVNVAADGTISTDVDPYVLPAASHTTLGGVIVPPNSGFNLAADGTLSIDSGSVTVPDNSIGEAAIKDGAVSSSKIADGAVTYEKCAKSLRDIIDSAEAITSGGLTELDITRVAGDESTVKAYTWGPCVVIDFVNFQLAASGSDSEWRIAAPPSSFSGTYVGFSGELLPYTLEGVSKGYLRMGWSDNYFTLASNGSIDTGVYSVTGRYVMIFTN